MSGAKRPVLAATLWLAFLGPYFFLVYGFCNWVTSLKPHVGTFFFEWERSLPVVPALIVPYMSMDLFFCVSFFLCATRPELLAHAKRLFFAITASALGFLVFPLRFAFPRPEPDGFFGAIFKVLTSFDLPYNQAPSLHISLLALVWHVHARHTRGLTRRVLDVWFFLIGLSTLLTYQHHFIDLPTGALVAVAAFYLFPERDAAERTAPSRAWPKLAAAYLLGAAILTAGAVAFRPWGLLLLWPAVSLTLVGLGYAGLGVDVFRKKDGRLSPSARLLLAPYLAGVRLSLRLQTLGQPPFHEVLPGLRLGRSLGEAEARRASASGVTAVLDLTAELDRPRAFRDLRYLCLPVLDLTPPTSDALTVATRFIRDERAKGTVYLHCALGYGRSAAVAAAYLVSEGLVATPEEAIRRLGAVRPGIALRISELLS